MAHGTPQEVTAKWLRNLQGATQEMQAGVDRLTVSPGQSAAAKQQKWINALQDQAVQQKWARNVASVSLPQWQQAMKDYGINRVSQGAQAKQSKTEAAFNSLLPFIDRVAGQVRALPDNTPADREQRALAMMRGMRTYQRPAG